MLNVIYYAPTEVERGQLVQQLLDFSDKQITQIKIRRMRDQFSVQSEQVSDVMHKQVIDTVFGITYEVVGNY